MSGETVLIEIGPDRTAWLYGRAHVVQPVLRQIRAPRQYDKVRRAIAIPISHVDDVRAAFELRAGVEVRVELVLA